jgi:hypothetical protein
LSVSGEALISMFERVITEYADRHHDEELERDRLEEADRDSRAQFLERLNADGRKVKRYRGPVRAAAVAAITRARARVQAGTEPLVVIRIAYVHDRSEHGALAAAEERAQRSLDRLETTITSAAPPPCSAARPARKPPASEQRARTLRDVARGRRGSVETAPRAYPVLTDKEKRPTH